MLHDGAFVGSGVYVFVEMYVSELACTCLGICVYIASVTNKDVWDDEKEKSLKKECIFVIIYAIFCKC